MPHPGMNDHVFQLQARQRKTNKWDTLTTSWCAHVCAGNVFHENTALHLDVVPEWPDKVWSKFCPAEMFATCPFENISTPSIMDKPNAMSVFYER